MATEWYYTKSGTKHGPVSSHDLRVFARDGKLAPTDLVWKEGMKEWQPASKVEGLFDASTPPEPPPIKQSQTSTPDIASAAKGLFASVTAKAQELGAKATAKAKEMHAAAQETLANQMNAESQGFPGNSMGTADSQTGQASTRVPPVESRRTITDTTPITEGIAKLSPKALAITGIGCGGLLVLVTCLGFIGSLMSPLTPATSRRVTSTKTWSIPERPGFEMGGLKSFEDHPTPIIDSLGHNRVVWLLNGFTLEGGPTPVQSPDALYLVFLGDELEYVCLKEDHTGEKRHDFQKDFGDLYWTKYPKSDKVSDHAEFRCYIDWQGATKEGHATATKHEKSRIATDPNVILETDKTTAIQLRWNAGGDECSWEAEEIYSSNMIARGQEIPQRRSKTLEGFGKRLSP